MSQDLAEHLRHVAIGYGEADAFRALERHRWKIHGVADVAVVQEIDQLIGELFLGLGLLDVGAVQAFDVLAVEDGRHRSHGFEIGT